jgi:hypothetical protein
MIDTGLLASCGDWSPNGTFLAVGGTPCNASFQAKQGEPEHVHIYDTNGKVHLQSKCFFIEEFLIIIHIGTTRSSSNL